MPFDSYQCPETGTPLQKAGPTVIDIVNQSIAKKEVFTVSGKEVEESVSDLWICPETKRGFPQRDGIICLIQSESFRLRKLPIDFSNFE